MAQELINLGALADDGTGDTIRRAGVKINANFTELYERPFAKSSLGIIQNEISTTQSNADIVFKPSGTGNIVFPAITLNDNNIEGTRSNEDLHLRANGAGRLVIEGIGFGGTTISSSDSSSVNINENLVVDGDFSINDGFTFSGAQTFASGMLIADFTLSNGSIANSSGAISFGDENLTTTGTLSAETGSAIGNITFADGSITDSSGSIAFGNENLSTTGTISAGSGSTFGNLTLANGSITDSSGAITFDNENLTTTGTSFQSGTLIVSNGSITDGSGAISFGNENVTTTGTIARATGSTIGNLTLANGSITDSSGAISFGNENLTTTATSIAINSTLTVGNGSITDSSGAISFGNENVTTTGTIARATGSTIGNLTLANGSITDSSGAIDFGNENLTTSGNIAIGSTMTAGSGAITDTTGAISFGNDNLTTTGTLDVSGLSTLGSVTTVSGATSFAGSTTVDNLTFNDNIISTSSNADLNLSPGGTGVVNVSNLTIDSSINLTDNVIKVTKSNDDFVLSGNGTGSVQISKIDMDQGTVDNTVIGATTPAAGNFTTVSFTVPNINAGNVNITDNKIKSTDTDGNLLFLPSGSGNVFINGFTFPNTMVAGRQIKTDANKVLSTVAPPSFVVTDTDVQDGTTSISFASRTDIDHVTATGQHDRIESAIVAQDSFPTSQYDSAFYLALNRDDASDEFQVAKHSVVHNNSDAFVTSSVEAKTGTNNHVVTTADINGGNVRLLGTGSSPENSVSYYRIGLGDDDSTGYSGEDEAAVVINTDVDSASEVIDSWAHASFRGAKYYISVNNASKTELMNCEATLVHNGTDAFVSTYNIVNTGNNDLITLTAAINGSNVELKAAGLETNLRVHAYRIRLADNESDRSSTNINVIGNVLVSNSTRTDIDHVTAAGKHDRIESGTSIQDTFVTSQYDSAWYLAINRDETSTEFEVTKHSVVHNNTNAFVSTSVNAKTGTNNHIITSADIDSGNVRLLGTGSSPENSVSYYRIGLGDDDSTGYSGEDEAAVVINTDVDSASEVIDSWAHASFRGAKYYISVNNASKTELMNCEATVVHNGTNAFISTYNIVNTGSNDLLTLTAAINGSNVELKAAGLETNLRVHAYRIRLADNEADRSSTNINVIGDVTVSSASTTLDTFDTGTYQGAHYIIVSHNASEGASAICEAAVVSDGTNAFVTQYGLTSSKGTDQLLLTVGHAGSTTTLSATSTSGGSTKVNAYRVNLTRGAPASATKTLDTFDTGTYQGAHYVIVSHSATEGHSQICEAAVVSDGTNAFVTQYGLTSTKITNQIILTASHAGSTTTLSATSLSGQPTTVNAYRVNLARGAGTSSATATLDSISATAFRAVFYNVQVTDTVGNNFESFEVKLVHDGSNVFTTVYGNVGNVTNLIAISGDIDSGNLRLRGAISNTNDHDIVVVRRIIKV